MNLLRAGVVGLLCAAALPVLGQNPQRGRQVYETHCGGCHYARVHERERGRSIVKSYAALRVEVARWAAQVARPFTLEDLDDIAAYLNQSHYGFTR